MSIDALIARMERVQPELTTEQRYFHDTYLRTTKAVKAELAAEGFRDPDWVERWDVAFADLYLEALEAFRSGGRVPRPWQITFRAGVDSAAGQRLPPLRHVLLGMNAHINYDLPQALLAVITDFEFDDPMTVGRRGADHAHIDEILAARVAAEDEELRAVEQPGDRTWLDRILQPLNRWGTRRFLSESRAKVWANAQTLSQARRSARLTGELKRLEDLAADRVADLVRPGQVLLTLAVRGFGVRL